MVVPDAMPNHSSQIISESKTTALGWRVAYRWVPLVAVLIPPIYLLVMMLRSAVVYPFWDELALVPAIGAFMDGTLQFSDLIQWHSQSRPLFPRLVFIVSAALTRWDLRLEFVWLYLTFLAVLVLHLATLRRLSSDLPKAPFLAAAVLVSILIFSPGGNTLHWYSLMLMPLMGNLFTTLALILLAFRAEFWMTNIVCAALAWIATYSLSNGLIIFPAVCLTLQIAAPRPWMPTRRCLFWFANMIACYALYLPGLPPGASHPSLFEFGRFVLAYLGMPLAYLIWYPVGLIYSPAKAVAWPIIPGAVLLGLAGFALPFIKTGLRAGRPEAFLAILFSTLAIGSAFVTAWGRAAGEYGLATAEASRYTIFGVYLALGVLYWYVPHIARSWKDLVPSTCRRLATVFCVFVALSIVTFGRALSDYRWAIELNRSIAMAYDNGPHPGQRDSLLYPDTLSIELQRAKEIMWSHRIGPFRSRSDQP